MERESERERERERDRDRERGEKERHGTGQDRDCHPHIVSHHEDYSAGAVPEKCNNESEDSARMCAFTTSLTRNAQYTHVHVLMFAPEVDVRANQIRTVNNEFIYSPESYRTFAIA